jgi:hypothetical protein
VVDSHPDKEEVGEGGLPFRATTVYQEEKCKVKSGP